MDLTSQLIPALVCLLAFTSTFVHGQNFNNTLKEIIKTLNILTARNDSCMELTVMDVLAAPKNTSDKEIFCRATTVLRQIYTHHNCSTKFLKGLDRNLSSMANRTCSVNEVKKSTLKDFLERLKAIMQKKYSKH
ncbi:interleukin-4 [Prionailurus viverrinus]|uniref:Interleukin-4 n=3 Tax=Felinae TaxID=338152 RepID=A0A6I9ZLE3_ACIJB|nr:interleukin-4 [Acinonyx jubatus]XP_025780053.1 interleukin-4 [Puma concolor]XP_040300679.1 interleukin-4 [Puma yagouaroundi]XP_043418750.1 interleukin-4 [Prionailurus bengalensis]XP_045339229.1 interleukin-4 [Leopardus geoffroyi]XP_047724123.1 interleukin-4 [Prionailurus viverrinus]